MPRYEVMIDGHKYEVSSDRELSNAEAEQHVRANSGAAPSAPEPAHSSVGSFLSGAWDETKNAVKGVGSLLTTNPVTTAKGMWDAQMKPFERAGAGHANGDSPIDTAIHGLNGLVPLMGPWVDDIATEMANTGDYAHGAGRTVGGTLTGEAMGHAAPIAKATAPYAGRATSAVGRGMEALGEATKKPMLNLGTIEALAHSGPAGVGVVAAPYAAKYGGKGLQKLGGMLEGLKGETAPAAAAKVAPDAMSPRLAKSKAPVLNDSISSALSALMDEGAPASSKLADTPNVRTGEFGGSGAAEKAAKVAHDGADGENRFHAPYGDGSIMPPDSSVLPTEMRDAAMEGLHSQTGQVWDQDYGGVVPDFTFEGEANARPGEYPPSNQTIPQMASPNEQLPSFTHEGAANERPGEFAPSSQTIPQQGGGDITSAIDALSKETGNAPSKVRTIPRADEQWGPASGGVVKGGEAQAFPRKGEPGYVPTRANLLYDPQTPTAYLREQLSGALDPAEREFLARAIAQRSTIDRARVGLAQSLQ